jgi:phosphoribosylaminoimidazolecarboxamide formyltransferase / IMP cyclohydrolase
MVKVKRALISVFHKQGIIDFALALQKYNIEIVSTGGTAKIFEDNGIKCRQISDLTQFPEMLDGRLKTLHPVVHGGILAKRDNPKHMQQLERAGIGLIDLVVVNLYPFEQVISKADVTLAEAIENIDIGGPTMIRAAAKNYNHVGVVTDPSQYQAIIDELEQNNGGLLPETLFKLATEAFQLTNRYDGIVTQYLSNVEKKEVFPERFSFSLKKAQELRYGENPHQQAAFYYNVGRPRWGIANLQQLQGKELSYNNIVDLDSVVRMVTTFKDPSCVIVKHNNPCGVAVGEDSYAAFQKAFATDPTSAFGGIYGFNSPVDSKLADELSKIFIEVIVAPEFSKEALEVFSKKKNLRLLIVPAGSSESHSDDIIVKNVMGGLLVQTEDLKSVDDIDLKVVSKRKPSEAEWAALKFGWNVVKWVKSNAIVFVKEDRTIGIGAGQMSRVDSTILAADKAKRSGLSLTGTVVASDAYFPFRDGIDQCAQSGATAVIEPGGSIRDDEVIQAADEHNLALVFTGVRHFRH